MKHLEDNLTMSCVSWFKISPYKDALIMHIPNGGKRNAREAARFKLMGVLPGVPDLFIAAQSGNYGGLWIDLKVGKNKPTQAQADVMTKLYCEGYATAICRSVPEFIGEVTKYFEGDNQ